MKNRTKIADVFGQEVLEGRARGVSKIFAGLSKGDTLSIADRSGEYGYDASKSVRTAEFRPSVYHDPIYDAAKMDEVIPIKSTTPPRGYEGSYGVSDFHESQLLLHKALSSLATQESSTGLRLEISAAPIFFKDARDLIKPKVTLLTLDVGARFSTGEYAKLAVICLGFTEKTVIRERSATALDTAITTFYDDSSDVDVERDEFVRKVYSAMSGKGVMPQTLSMLGLGSGGFGVSPRIASLTNLNEVLTQAIKTGCDDEIVFGASDVCNLVNDLKKNDQDEIARVLGKDFALVIDKAINRQQLISARHKKEEEALEKEIQLEVAASKRKESYGEQWGSW